MYSRYKYILCDLDNTILDFDTASRLAFNDVMKQYDLPADDDHYSLYHSINKRLWNTVENGKIKQSEIKYSRWKRYFDRISTYRDATLTNNLYFDGLVRHPVMWPGAMDMMNQLKGHVHLSATTNGIGSVQRRRIISAGLDIYFDEVVISDEIGFAKPAAAYFDHTFNRLLHPEKNDVIILGDNLGSDIRGGVNYGIDACWFNPNKGTKAYGNIHPTYEISELSDFVAVIK